MPFFRFICLSVLLWLSITATAQTTTDAAAVDTFGLFREPPAGPPHFNGQFSKAAGDLGKGGDLVFLFETQAVKWQRWHSSKARRIKTVTHSIALDTNTQEAWYQTYTVDVKYPRKEKNASKKKRQISEFSSRKSVSYVDVLNAFRRLDSLGFHRLDPEQLTSMNGPPNPDGSVPMTVFTHTSNTWTYLKAGELWYGIVTYAPGMIYEMYPKIYPDRGKWIEGFDTMRALVR